MKSKSSYSKIKLTGFIFFLLLAFYEGRSQNVAITDDNGYTANPSAMLDVKSIDKGVLIPRVTTAQRTAIISPAKGLLIFDSDLGNFYFYNGAAWVNLTSSNASGIWSKTGSNISTTVSGDHVGVGTAAPLAKLEVRVALQ